MEKLFFTVELSFFENFGVPLIRDAKILEGTLFSSKFSLQFHQEGYPKIVLEIYD